MAIQKQEYYEGAALHLLIRNSPGLRIAYDHPFFVFNDRIVIHLKHSTAKRSPWGFTFMPDEQAALRERARRYKVWIGMVCGSDGVAGLDYERYSTVAPPSAAALHIACYRRHREHYEVSGPNGALQRKVAPSDWSRILDE